MDIFLQSNSGMSFSHFLKTRNIKQKFAVWTLCSFHEILGKDAHYIEDRLLTSHSHSATLKTKLKSIEIDIYLLFGLII